jgi:hypothetical protein
LLHSFYYTLASKWIEVSTHCLSPETMFQGQDSTVIRETIWNFLCW